ncbi:MAG: hypothetical protein WAT39_07250 [Planctomycetota bacterium]
MKSQSLLGSSLVFLFAACAGTPPAPVAPDKPAEPVAAAGAGADKKPDPKADEAKQKAEKRKQQQKELRNKQRELESAQVENRIAEMDRTVRQWGVDAALKKTATELEQAQKTLKLFLDEVKPREVEEKKINLDQSTYYAEHQKDELGELEAMYQADEFAAKTKELVLKRGRRSLEMAERSLAIARRENAQFLGVTLPDRERELRQKVTDAELERRKAETEAEKAKIEFAQAIKKAQFRLADLQEEIADLEKSLAEDKS